MKTGIKAEIVFLILIVVSLVGLLTMTVNAATTEKVANKAREKTIAELYSGTIVVFAKVDVAEFMTF